MAITAAFSSSQTIGAPSIITLTDDSTGTFGTIVSRKVYIVNAAGEYITASGTSTTVAYTTWAVASGSGDTVDIDCLQFDSALNITVDWCNSGGTVINTVTTLCGFTLYNETEYYSLTQAQASQNQPPPMIIQDSNYYTNKLILRTNIDSGNQAISLGDDITSAQSCYDLATYMTNNESDFF